MTAEFRPEVVENWFFAAPLVSDTGVLLAAPEEAKQKFLEVRQEWILGSAHSDFETRVVALRPVRTGPVTGWRVEKAVGVKPNTLSPKLM